MDESKSGPIRRGRVAMAPRLEALEGRRLMAANATQVGIKEVTTNGVVDLVITGTSRPDVIHVTDNGTGAAGNVSVKLGDGRTYVAQAAIGMIEVAGKGGDDQVTYDLAGSLVVPRSVLVNLGAGNDRFTANLAGDVANPTGLDLEALGGAGNDTMTINQTGRVLRGSSLAYLEGDAGNDTLAFNGSGTVAAGASLLPGLSGGAGNDRLTSHYAGILAGNYIYNLSVDGGAGDDVIDDDVRLLAGSTGTVGTGPTTPAAVTGGAGNDRIRFAVEVDPGAAPAGINAVAVGGLGKDVVRRTSNVQGDATNEKDAVIA